MIYKWRGPVKVKLVSTHISLISSADFFVCLFVVLRRRVPNVVLVDMNPSHRSQIEEQDEGDADQVYFANGKVFGQRYSNFPVLTLSRNTILHTIS